VTVEAFFHADKLSLLSRAGSHCLARPENHRFSNKEKCQYNLAHAGSDNPFENSRRYDAEENFGVNRRSLGGSV
jgi:hypothetical protein